MFGTSGQQQARVSDPVSWWWQDAMGAATDEPVCPPLMGSQQADVVIVGGGYTGLWTALALKERQPALHVVVIEAQECGSGASGKNGGKVHGYWSSLAGMIRSIGADAALQVARAGTQAQDAIRAFATAPGRDVWWRESGNMKVSTTPAQDALIQKYIDAAGQLGVGETAQRLSPAEVQARCGSPVFRGGIYFPEGATVHPARLARALRSEALARGVSIFEHTPAVGLDTGSPNRVRTPNGAIVAREVVLATNTALATHPAIRPTVCVFSSYALMTEPAGEQLEALGWQGDEGLTDLRMFLHYFRKARGGRVLMGSGSGPIGYAGAASGAALLRDPASTARTEAGLRRLLPSLSQVPIAHRWSGAIDVSADRLPFFRTLAGTRVHYGCGYSGHGVNATYLGGQCLASLALGLKDAWSSLPFCTRELPTLPPEPWRTWGGRVIRWGIMSCEQAEEQRVQAPATARAVAALPGLFGLRIGTR